MTKPTTKPKIKIRHLKIFNPKKTKRRPIMIVKPPMAPPMLPSRSEIFPIKGIIGGDPDEASYDE